MNPIQFNAQGDLIIAPAASSSQHDFDFLQGSWQVHNRKLRSRLNNCTEWTEFPAMQELRKILLGMGNTDTFSTTFDGKPFEGMTLRLFNPATRLWSIYWADSNMVTMDPPVVGSFHEGIGHFFTKDIYNGQDIIVRFNLLPIPLNRYGVRPSQPIKEKPGNGTGICISTEFNVYSRDTIYCQDH